MSERSRIPLLLTVIVLFATACGGGGTTATTTPPSTSPAVPSTSVTLPAATSTSVTTDVATSVTSAAVGSSETLAGILDRNVVRVGVGRDLSPFRVGIASATPAGFEPTLASAVAAVLAPGAAVEFVEVSAATRFESLAAGEVDMVLRLTVHTLSREDSAQFSVPYLLSGLVVLVEAGSGISSIEDLEGKTIGVLAGSSDELVLEEALSAASVNAATDPMEGFAQLVEAIPTGYPHAAAMSYPSAAVFQSQPGASFGVVAIDLLRDPMAIMTVRGDLAFQQEVSEALQAVIDDGTWLELFEEWIGTPPPWTVEEMAGVQPS
ncbi:MAG: amino acid ABC transporter substrate-binding protein [Acidimicrobiia bacterium]|nr:MAG: amino acid ABC transporter substrate-binding protein [Acidimicrobiia bacterium]